MAAAIVSTNYYNTDPEVGPEITIKQKGGTTDYKRRVVVGWNHQTDTPTGLQGGKIWGWVSDGEHFQVYDENFNRSDKAGEVRFCGVANFTMVRMFHPYWAHFGRPPRDMHGPDKERCRYKYKQLIRKWRVNNGMPVDDDLDNPIQPPGEGRRRGRGRGGRRAGRVRGGIQQRQRSRSPWFGPREDSVGGDALNDPIDIESDNEAPDVPPVRQAKRPAPNIGDMNDHIRKQFGIRGDADDKDDNDELKREQASQERNSRHPSVSQIRGFATPPLNVNLPDASRARSEQGNGPQQADGFTWRSSSTAVPATGDEPSMFMTPEATRESQERQGVQEVRETDETQETDETVVTDATQETASAIPHATGDEDNADYPPLPELPLKDEELVVIDMVAFKDGRKDDPIVIDDD